VSQFAQSYADHLPQPVDNSNEHDQTVHSEVPAHGPQRNSVPAPETTSVVDHKLTPEFQGLHDMLTRPMASAGKAGIVGDLVEGAAFL
jgi:hypothetical protein